jgi:hypothetical protein
MKAYQVGYNMVNNQIADILIDELGTVIMFDQNALPRHSMGEDWGKNNYAKAWVAMKDFQMLPLDTSITNTENATNFNHYQTLNMEQTSNVWEDQYQHKLQQVLYRLCNNHMHKLKCILYSILII